MSTTDELRHLTDDELGTLMKWLHGIRGPGVVDPDLPVDPENLPTASRPWGVRDWAGARLAEAAAERDRRETP